MKSNSDRKLPLARHAHVLCALAGIFFVSQFSPTAFASDPKEPAPVPEKHGEPGAPHSSIFRTGVLDTKDGLTLRLTADLGSVNITQIDPASPPVVRYTVHVETDAHGSNASQLLNHYSLKALTSPGGVEIVGALFPPGTRYPNAQFWVQFDIAIPRNYNVEVNTGAGDITTGDIGGTAVVKTQGGAITAGHIGKVGYREVSRGRLVAKLETEGGHIKVMEVTGDLSAFTAGGHINAGDITGDASLHSGGGHIRAGKIGGRADLDTAGGNIAVGKAAGFVSVRTGGGQIDFGEVGGSVRAQTAGGGIHVMYVSGPIEVESSGGSICVTGASGTVQAATSGGSITAWINPSAPAGSRTVRLEAPSQLTSGTGDIIVFLPRNLAANIDVLVLNGTQQHIEADSAMHLVVQGPGNGVGPVHANGVVNGGGAPLKLRTTGGKIRLQFMDSQVALHESLVQEQKVRLNKRMGEAGLPPLIFPPAIGPEPAINPRPDEKPIEPPKNLGDLLEDWLNDWEQKFRSSSEEPDDFFNRITFRPAPTYPPLALRAGIHGFVTLQVKLTKDGRIEVQRVLQGEPVLADAAIVAVKQWRGNPKLIKGKPVEVVSTVKFDFQLP